MHSFSFFSFFRSMGILTVTFSQILLKSFSLDYFYPRLYQVINSSVHAVRINKIRHNVKSWMPSNAQCLFIYKAPIMFKQQIKKQKYLRKFDKNNILVTCNIICSCECIILRSNIFFHKPSSQKTAIYIHSKFQFTFWWLHFNECC